MNRKGYQVSLTVWSITWSKGYSVPLLTPGQKTIEKQLKNNRRTRKTMHKQVENQGEASQPLETRNKFFNNFLEESAKEISKIK